MNTEEDRRRELGTGDIRPNHLTFSELLNLADLELQPSVNKTLFLFARGLETLSMQRDKQFTVPELHDMFLQWHRRYEHMLPEKHGVELDDLFFDLLEKIKRVETPYGWGLAELAWDQALANFPPREALQFQRLELQQLTALCRQLQLAAGDEPFYLSCRTVQSLMGLSTHHQAARWLKGLVAVGVLKEIEKGGPHNNKATRYRYVQQG